jgi:hypothetical protein
LEGHPELSLRYLGFGVQPLSNPGGTPHQIRIFQTSGLNVNLLEIFGYFVRQSLDKQHASGHADHTRTPRAAPHSENLARLALCCHAFDSAGL